jgi:hypothetical protein
VAFCPAAHASPNKKFDFLLRFFDLNEAAFAYHRHCVSSSEQLNPKFLKTMEFVADELYTQAEKNNPTIKPEHIKGKILERRYKLQYSLDSENIKSGCGSGDSNLAKAHYVEFSRYDIPDIRLFIDENTRDQ